MEPISELQITCTGVTTVGLDELTDLQGDLKDLTEENYAKLRNSFTKYGFTIPFFYWEDPEGTKFVIDGHQRMRTLRAMRIEGIAIPPLPAIPIQAIDKIQAKEKLLLINSRYGDMTQEGFDQFVSDMPIDDLEDLLAIPDVMFGETETSEKEDKGDEIKTQEVVCPACNHRFTIVKQ